MYVYDMSFFKVFENRSLFLFYVYVVCFNCFGEQNVFFLECMFMFLGKNVAACFFFSKSQIVLGHAESCLRAN